MQLVPQSWGSPLVEFNQCHSPGGSPVGGQFCASLGSKPVWVDGGDYDTQRKTDDDWGRKVLVAVAMGQITPKQARDLGWYPPSHVDRERRGTDEGWEPLPPTLYHVSTGFEGVLRKGLLSRAEQDGVHRGLGGGDDETISFTDDLKVARAIRSAVLEARRVVRGELTPAKMLAMAKAQPNLVAGTPRATYMQSQGPVSAYEMLVGFYAGKTWHKGDPIPRNLRLLLKGVQIQSTGDMVRDGLLPKGSSVALNVRDVPKGMTPMGQWEGADGQRFTSHLVRKMTKDEQLDAAFEMYKRYATAREYAGGRMDPLFFMTDRKALAAVKVRDIKILQFKPRRAGVRGYRLSALGEWRVPTGRTVKYSGLAESS